MGSNPTKAMDNIYCQSRKKAAMYNPKLNSREGAAELLGVSPTTLSDYELGHTKTIPKKNVMLMADLYKAPQILNHYCTTHCPIGQLNVPKLEVAELDRLTLKLLSSFQKAKYIKESLIEITADGVITPDETELLEDVLHMLESISTNAQELKLWAEITLKKEV